MLRLLNIATSDKRYFLNLLQKSIQNENAIKFNITLGSRKNKMF